jgi:hypothetical protein
MNPAKFEKKPKVRIVVFYKKTDAKMVIKTDAKIFVKNNNSDLEFFQLICGFIIN